jgi:chromosome segregation ATPase
MKKMNQIVQERMNAITILQNASSNTMANLDDPEVNPIDEARLRPVVQEAVKIQREFDALHLRCGFGGMVREKMAKFNDEVGYRLNDAIAAEQRAKRRAETARKDIEVRHVRPKIVLIDDDWIDASREMNHNLLLLKELNAAIKMFKEEAGRLASENRNVNDRIASSREELFDLERFLPGENPSDPGDGRFEWTRLEGENEILQMKIFVARQKLQVENEKLGQIQGKLKKMPTELEKQQATLEFWKKERRAIEEALENLEMVRANLLAEQDFALDQKRVLEKRSLDTRAEIEAIRAERKKQELVLKRQELMISLSDEMAALRKMNLQRVAGKVQTLLKINSEIDEFA